MALTIATGLELGTADSYISVADADAYHASLQNDEWSVVDFARKEALLRRSSILIDARYVWKTTGVIYTATPRALQIATAEAALYSIAQDLMNVQAQAVRSVSIGSLSVSFDNSSQSLARQQTIWDFLDMMLSGLGDAVDTGSEATGPTGWGQITLVRA